MEILQCSRVDGIHYTPIAGQMRFAAGYTDYEDFYSMPDWLERGGYQGNEIRFLDLLDQTVTVPFPKQRNVLYGNALWQGGAVWFLKGDFNDGTVTLFRWTPEAEPEAVQVLPVDSLDLYNLQILGDPVHIISQGSRFHSYWPEQFSFDLAPNESAVHVEDGRVYCSAWVEEGIVNGEITGEYRYYETTVVRDRQGQILSRVTGDLQLFSDGIWRLS